MSYSACILLLSSIVSGYLGNGNPKKKILLLNISVVCLSEWIVSENPESCCSAVLSSSPVIRTSDISVKISRQSPYVLDTVFVAHVFTSPYQSPVLNSVVVRPDCLYLCSRPPTAPSQTHPPGSSLRTLFYSPSLLDIALPPSSRVSVSYPNPCLLLSVVL